MSEQLQMFVDLGRPGGDATAIALVRRTADAIRIERLTHREPSGEELKAHALDQVEDGASEWLAAALAMLATYLDRYVAEEFRIEQFRAYATANGLPAPRSHHAWGSLPRNAVRAGLIAWTGRFEAAQSARTHGHPVRVYRRVR